MKVLRHIRDWRLIRKKYSEQIKPTQFEILEPRLLLSADSLSEIITSQQTQYIYLGSTSEIVQNENITIQTVDDMVVDSSGSQILLSENFNDGDYNAWILVQQGANQGPMNWSAATGVMVQSSNVHAPVADGISKLGTYAYWQAGFGWTDYTAKITIKSNDNDGIGIMFRYQDENNYYRFIWDKERNSRALVKAEDGQFTILAENFVPYVTGRNYHVQIWAMGSALQVSIDGSQVFSVSDSTFSSGTIALYSWGNVGACFDDIIVGGLAGANQAPVITSVTASPAIISDVQTSHLQVVAYDPDSGPDPLTYSWSVPAGAGSLDNPNIADPIYTPPDVSSTQTFTLKVNVFDGLNTASHKIDITATDSQGPPILLLEDFNDGDYNGWKLVEQGTRGGYMVWSAESGEMVQSSNVYSPSSLGISRLGTYAYWQAGSNWTDYIATVKMKSNDDDGIGVMFRYQDENNYYRFIWDKARNSRALVKAENGQFTILAEDFVPYVTGREYQVRISAQGSALQVSIDGSPVFSVNDSTFLSGTIALYCWGDVGAYFDDITVKGSSGVNQAPVITSVTASPSNISNTDTSQLQVVAYDPDSGPNPLTYSWSVPTGAGSLDNANIANPIYTPPIVNGTQTFPLTVDVFDGLNTTSQTVNITVTDTVYTSWQPPIGIPAPSFGINETVDMYIGQQYTFTDGRGTIDYPISPTSGKPYTHYIDNTHPNATDYDNIYGTPNKPRKTIPWDLPAGSVAEVHGGPYTDEGQPYTNYWTWFSGNGTQQKPVFIRGTQGEIPEFIGISRTLSIRAGGSYVIIENFNLNNTNIDVSVLKDSHHISIRNLEVHGGPPINGTAIYAGVGKHIVIYNNYIHDNGDPNWYTENDYHAVSAGARDGKYAEYVWIVDNHMHGNGGDSVQINSGNVPIQEVARYIYIGRNIMHEEGENAVDLKQCADVVVSQNTMYGFDPTHFASSGSDGTAVIIEDDTPHENIWVIFNEIYDSQNGIRAQDSANIIGNKIYNIHNNSGYDPTATWNGLHVGSCGIIAWGAKELNVIGNTFYDVDSGIQYPGGGTGIFVNIIDNIISNLAQPTEHIGLGTSGAAANAEIRNNLLYQPGGTVNIIGYGAVMSANYIIDPLFVDASNDDFTLQTGSPAIDAGISSGIVQQVFDTFQTLYGIDIKMDIEGNPRIGIWDIGAYEIS